MKRNLHLLISTPIVLVAAYFYGFRPASVFPLVLDISVTTPDEHSVFRALMGLYTSMAILWMLGIVRPSFWKVATISNLFFMGGIALGRFFSILYDGIPSALFLYGFWGEAILAVFACYQWFRFSGSKAP
ncbi:MAG: DUF4345 domain-containing protein [Flavobacterium sp.]